MIPAIIMAIENDDDREFMSALYINLYPLMKTTAYTIVKDTATAEDLAQDAIAKLIDKIDTLRSLDERRQASYVISTVTNISKNYYNKHLGAKNIVLLGIDDDHADEVYDETESIERSFDVKEDYKDLGEAIKKLPEKDRALLYLKYNLEKSDQEIGEILNINKNSVREYLTRARRKARKYITRK